MNTEASTPSISKDNQNFLKKYWWLVMVIGIILVLGLVVLIIFLSRSGQSTQIRDTPNNNQSNNTLESENVPGGLDLGDPNSSDPIEKGKALSGGNCSGTGSKVLGSAPMRPEELSVIIPYGLLAGGHVTPIDHQYYWGKVQMGNPDMYDVLSPADGKLVTLEFRDRSGEGKKVKGDYRGVIMYSCTFFSYFDLATSLSPEIQAQLPEGWESKGNIKTDINLKEGQVIGKVGGQSLDFAVWDTTKTLKNLLVPVAYNNSEPWKIVTVPPLDYFSEEVKALILPFYAGSVNPKDGIIDRDIDGTLSGNWFLEGTNGYVGVSSYSEQGTGIFKNGYWAGHLAIVPNHIDPSAWMFSIGDLNGQAWQYAIKNPTILPSSLKVESGKVKLELAQISYMDSKGNGWLGERGGSDIKMNPGISQGVVLVQLLETRKLKMEVFLGKTLSQVSDFTSAARIYDRGDNAKMLVSNTAF